MTNSEINEFIDNNTTERLQQLLNQLLDKLKELNKRVDRMTILGVVLAIIYYTTPLGKDTYLQLGPLTVKDFTIVVKLIPIVFAYCMVDFALVSGSKAELLKTIKLIFLNTYKYQALKEGLLDGHFPFLVRLLLPFSLYNELLKIKMNKFTGCATLIILSPFVLFFILPFYFEYIIAKDLYLHYWNDWITRFSLFMAGWLNVVFFYYYIVPMKQRIAVAEKDLKGI